MAGVNGVRNACFCAVPRFLPEDCVSGSTAAFCPAWRHGRDGGTAPCAISAPPHLPFDSASASALPGNMARTGSRYPAPRAAPTERGRAGAARLSSQGRWSCWLLVLAVLGDSVLLGATPMEDMDLVIHPGIRSSHLIVLPLTMLSQFQR